MATERLTLTAIVTKCPKRGRHLQYRCQTGIGIPKTCNLTYPSSAVQKRYWGQRASRGDLDEKLSLNLLQAHVCGQTHPQMLRQSAGARCSGSRNVWGSPLLQRWGSTRSTSLIPLNSPHIASFPFSPTEGSSWLSALFCLSA